MLDKARELRATTFARWRGHEPEIAILAVTTLILTVVAIAAGADLLFTLLAAATATVIIWSPWRGAAIESSRRYESSTPLAREHDEAMSERHGTPYAEEVEAMQQRKPAVGTQRLDGLRVAILVTNGFERVELTEPRKALEAAGATTLIIAPHPGEVQSMNHDVKAEKYKVDMTLDEADPDNFDGVLLPGGALNADILRMNERARDFVRRISESGKPIAAICHAPWLLVSAGLVEGRTITSFFSLQDDIRNAGGRWVDREVVRDRNLVSSRGPRDIPVFNGEMISLFAESARARRRAA